MVVLQKAFEATSNLNNILYYPFWTNTDSVTVMPDSSVQMVKQPDVDGGMLLLVIPEGNSDTHLCFRPTFQQITPLEHYSFRT